MAVVVGVVFPGGVKVYHFDPAGIELADGDSVVVQTSTGPEIGRVVEPPREVDDSEIQAALKKVQRVATDKDFEAQAASDGLRRESMATCRELIRSHGLDMKLVGAEMGFGGEKITFSFFSEERVDFRSLVADLGKALQTRVELRQVGAREEARMVGGLGPCGRALCCATFPVGDEPVSIRMAKEQNLPLNPTKISGLCGRLMCCLKYEQEQYVCFRKEAPPKGTRVVMPSGEGVVTGYVVTKDALAVRMEDGSHEEVPLRTCERQDDGSLLVTPEEKPMAPSPWDVPFGLGRPMAADRESPQAAAAGGGAGGNAELGGSGEATAGEGARPSRSRRSRNRRKGRGRGQGQPQGQPAGEGAGRGPGQGPGQGPGGQSSGGRPSSGEGAGQGQAGHGQRGGAPGAVSGGGNASGAQRSRRRRRPRRPGGAAGGGSGDSGGGGNGGGAGGS